MTHLCLARPQEKVAASESPGDSSAGDFPELSAAQPRREYRPPGAWVAPAAASDAALLAAASATLAEPSSMVCDPSPAIPLGVSPAVAPGAVPPAPQRAASCSSAQRRATLSIDAVRAALEEICASTVSDVGDLLCCPITFVRSLFRCIHVHASLPLRRP